MPWLPLLRSVSGDGPQRCPDDPARPIRQPHQHDRSEAINMVMAQRSESRQVVVPFPRAGSGVAGAGGTGSPPMTGSTCCGCSRRCARGCSPRTRPPLSRRVSSNGPFLLGKENAPNKKQDRDDRPRTERVASELRACRPGPVSCWGHFPYPSRKGPLLLTLSTRRSGPR